MEVGCTHGISNHFLLRTKDVFYPFWGSSFFLFLGESGYCSAWHILFTGNDKGFSFMKRYIFFMVRC
ncbi:MAG: hypothetical protein CSA33_07100 [Desulfobulbus propionicus]|nr:MAG: hypothetical protein CSA33_07100 [Desulfobulbus propionicus]